MTTAGTTTEQNRRTALRWLDLISEHDIEALCAITAPESTMQGGPPGLPAGAEGVRALFRSIGPVRQTWTVDDVIVEGDRVVIRATNTCEQDSFLGIPAAGVRQVFTATFVLWIVDGLVAQTWRNADDLGR